MLDSEKDSDVDTGFYSDDEEASPSKRRSLLVALKYVCVCIRARPFVIKNLCV